MRQEIFAGENHLAIAGWSTVSASFSDDNLGNNHSIALLSLRNIN